ACARRPGACAGRDEETALGSNKETDWKRTEAHQVSPSLMQVPTRRGVHRFQTGRVDLTAKRTNDVLRKPDNLTSYRQDRIVSGREVIAAKPDIIIGSWCGKKFVPAKVSAREGFAAIPAAAEGWLHEIKSALILQPGPAALTDGLDALVRIIAE